MMLSVHFGVRGPSLTGAPECIGQGGLDMKHVAQGIEHSHFGHETSRCRRMCSVPHEEPVPGVLLQQETMQP